MMKNPTKKKVAIGTAYASLAGGLAYATPYIAVLWPGASWLPIAGIVITAVTAFLHNSTELLEGK